MAPAASGPEVVLLAGLVVRLLALSVVTGPGDADIGPIIQIFLRTGLTMVTGVREQHLRSAEVRVRVGRVGGLEPVKEWSWVFYRRGPCLARRCTVDAEILNVEARPSVILEMSRLGTACRYGAHHRDGDHCSSQERNEKATHGALLHDPVGTVWVA
jgi:hypothetical protein